jgi:hypothetical protein
MGLPEGGRVRSRAQDEQEPAQPHRGGRQRKPLESSTSRERDPPETAPGQEQWRDDQVSEHVSHPPCSPGVGQLTRPDGPHSPEHRHANGRAEGGAQAGTEHDEGEDVREATEAAVDLDDPREQPDGDEGFQRVSDPDPQRRPQGGTAPGIRDHRSDGDRRPEARSSQEQGGQRDAGRGPDQRGEAADRADHQAQPRGQHVRDDEDDQLAGLLEGAGPSVARDGTRLCRICVPGHALVPSDPIDERVPQRFARRFRPMACGVTSDGAGLAPLLAPRRDVAVRPCTRVAAPGVLSDRTGTDPIQNRVNMRCTY